MNPIKHTESSMIKFNGTSNDDFNKFLAIHSKLDCSKAWISDNRHRALTHTLFWVKEVMIPIFGDYITLSNGDKLSVKDICEQHILEDYQMKFIPTPQDFLQDLEITGWMMNGNGIAPSATRLHCQPPKPIVVPEKIRIEEPKIFDFNDDVLLDGSSSLLEETQQPRPHFWGKTRGGSKVVD